MQPVRACVRARRPRRRLEMFWTRSEVANCRSGIALDDRRPAAAVVDGLVGLMRFMEAAALGCTDRLPSNYRRHNARIPRHRLRLTQHAYILTSDTRDFLNLFRWQAERHADILATMSARMSVSVSASWNAGLMPPPHSVFWCYSSPTIKT